ncbi:MAG: hypothetical protein ACTSVM_00060 [Candidatus Ranarchaeia archaeon]
MQKNSLVSSLLLFTILITASLITATKPDLTVNDYGKTEVNDNFSPDYTRLVITPSATMAQVSP